MLPLSYTLRSLAQRKMRNLLTAVGIGLAVLVAVAMLALSSGVIESIRATGHPLNVLILRKGADSIEFSAIDRREFDLLRFSPHVATSGDTPLASAELFLSTLVYVGDTPRQTLVRGVLPIALSVHDQVRLTEGRFPSQPGEIMAGSLAFAQLGLPDDALAPGQAIHFEGRDWRIVGRFEAPGTAYDAEIWAGLDDLMTAARRTELTSIVLRAKDPAAMDEILFDLDLRTDVLVAARPETDYYAAHAAAYQPVRVMVQAMAAMLVVGGLFIGMNTVFAAIVGRVREIGMLRTVGFRRAPIGISLLLEACAPALVGGILAGILALALNGMALRIPMGAFRLNVDATHIFTAVLLGLLIGLAGAVYPIWRSLRMKTVEAVRHL